MQIIFGFKALFFQRYSNTLILNIMGFVGQYMSRQSQLFANILSVNVLIKVTSF